MKRLLSILLALVALPVLAGVGDVDAWSVETNGWVIDAFVNGYNAANTNLSIWNLGWTSNYFGSGKIVLTIQSPGFNDDTTTNATIRTVQVTKQVRMAYPSMTNADTVIQGSDVKLRLALSDFVFTNDVLKSISWQSGFYSNNSAGSVSANITNLSYCSYTNTRPIANWTYPGWQRISGNTMTVRAVAFNRFATNGRPVRVMQFVAQDQHGHVSTNRVMTMSVDPSMSDAVPIPEYIGHLDVSAFTQGDLIRCDFEAYPWIGDGTSVCDTMDNSSHQPTPLYASITNLCDRLQTYGVTRALVATNGSAAGVATTNINFFTSPPAAFATINQAEAAIKATNNLCFSRPDCGAGEIYLSNNSTAGFGHSCFAWTDGSTAIGNAPATYCLITAWPGTPLGGVWITNKSGNAFGCMRSHLNNLFINGSANTFFDTETVVWCDSCAINHTGSLMVNSVTNFYFTDCQLTNLVQGLFPFSATSTTNCTFPLVRGCNLGVMSNSCTVYTTVGNIRPSTNFTAGNIFVNETAFTNEPQGDGIIFAYNEIFGLATHQGPTFCENVNTYTNYPHGLAIVNNVLEYYSSVSQPLLQIAADSSTVNLDNVILWNNDVIGQRVNADYNSIGSLAFNHRYWSKKNNSWDDDNIKTDTFTGGPENAGRIGNWPGVWGVGSVGNFAGNVNNVGTLGFTHTNFTWTISGGANITAGLPGLRTFETGETTFVGANYQQYKNNQGYTGAAAANGLGDYHILTPSPLTYPAFSQTDWVLPFDIEGNNRGGFDPPGAYSSAAPRKGGMFF